MEVLSCHSLTPPPMRHVLGTEAFIGLPLPAHCLHIHDRRIWTFIDQAAQSWPHVANACKDRISSHIIRTVVTPRSGELRMLTLETICSPYSCERSEVFQYAPVHYWRLPSTRPITSLDSHFLSHCCTVHAATRKSFQQFSRAAVANPLSHAQTRILLKCKISPFCCRSSVEEFKNQICTFFMSSSSPLTPNPLT